MTFSFPWCGRSHRIGHPCYVSRHPALSCAEVRHRAEPRGFGAPTGGHSGSDEFGKARCLRFDLLIPCSCSFGDFPAYRCSSVLQLAVAVRSQFSQDTARFASKRSVRAALLRKTSSSGTRPPVPKYISAVPHDLLDFSVRNSASAGPRPWVLERLLADIRRPPSSGESAVVTVRPVHPMLGASRHPLAVIPNPSETHFPASWTHQLALGGTQFRHGPHEPGHQKATAANRARGRPGTRRSAVGRRKRQGGHGHLNYGTFSITGRPQHPPNRSDHPIPHPRTPQKQGVF